MVVKYAFFSNKIECWRNNISLKINVGNGCMMVSRYNIKPPTQRWMRSRGACDHEGQRGSSVPEVMTDVTGRMRTEALGVTYILMNYICKCGWA